MRVIPSFSQVSTVGASSGLLLRVVLCCQMSRIGPISTGAVSDSCKLPVSEHVGRSVLGRDVEDMPMSSACRKSSVCICICVYVLCS